MKRSANTSGWPNSRTIVATTILAVLCVGFAHAADTVRICAYNILNYSLSNDGGRTDAFKRILDAIRPDLLVCSEVINATMGPHFVTNILTYAPFAATPFIDGRDTDNQLLYNQNMFTFLSQRVISTELRNIAEYTLQINPESDRLPDTLVIYSLHLKANNDASAAAQRSREIAALQLAVTNQDYVIACGDFNVYSPSEAAYQQLVSPTVGRRFVDPLGTEWQRDASLFAGWYTQSTRMTNAQGCVVGSTGGLDDRFDYIFVSEQLAPWLVPGSYTAFGNDSTSRLNSPLNEPPNKAVSAELAEALVCVSDHLPVYVDVVLGRTPASVATRDVHSLTIERVGDVVRIHHCSLGQPIRIINITGSIVSEWVADAPTVSLPLHAIPPGLYFVEHDNKRAVVIP